MDRRTLRRGLAYLTGRKPVVGPDGNWHRVELLEPWTTAAGGERYRWTARGRSMFTEAPLPGGKRRRKPRYVPIPGLMVESGLLDSLRPGTLAVFPFLQWLGREVGHKCYQPGNRVGWSCSVAGLAGLAGVSPRTVQRAVRELESLGIVDVARSSGRTNVYAFAGWLNIQGLGAVRLSESWRRALGRLGFAANAPYRVNRARWRSLSARQRRSSG